MTGQDAVKSADEFHKQLGITGVILTKMDGDARGGAALSIRSVTGQPLKFVGVGEKPDAFEPFHPDRVAPRILGMGDVLSLIEKAQEAFDQKAAGRDAAQADRGRVHARRLPRSDEADPQAGSARIDPGNDAAGRHDEGSEEHARWTRRRLTRLVAIVDSMTPKERNNHMIINGSRRRRIAKGSGTSVQEVNNLLKQYAQMRKMMKSHVRRRRIPGQEAGEAGRAWDCPDFRPELSGKILFKDNRVQMLMIRLARFGAKKKPTYRVVVIEKERARDSRNLKWWGTIIR